MATKKICVTGGAGFIGHHFIEAVLKNTDWEVVTVDRLDSTSTLHRLTDMDIWGREKGRVQFVFHDLRAEINDFVKRKIGEVDYIAHLAASTHVDRSITDPMLFVQDNIVGTCNLLNFARGLKHLEKMDYFSTDEVMGSAPMGLSYTETDTPRPENPYAASKLGAEALCHAYACTYRIPLFITRTMNVFGERQHREKFIPMTIRKVQAGEAVLIHADRTRTKSGSRFYIHARNVSAALIFLFKHGEVLKKEDRMKGLYNVVGEKEISNLELAQLIAGHLGKPLRYEMVDFHSSRPGHDLRYALDGTKLRRAGFQYAKTLEESLEKTVEWMVEHREWLEPR